ncbi:MAG: dTMP kinase [Planctomycetaceae bacterium]|nr:MAG: dTMP kinase [Planctomycetaceae bacterium]
MFFSFDGIDGTGKSTQMDLFAQFLRDGGHDVLTCRDPGGTMLGERLREILLHKAEIPLGGRAEMLLYMASRAQLVEEVIQPALRQEREVVCDRFLLANVVYQGHAGGLQVSELWQVGRVATGGTQPDLTFVLDMPVDAAAQRITGQLDRMESRGLDYMDRVRRGFLAEAARRDDVVVIDADREIAEIHDQIRTIVQARWPQAFATEVQEDRR